MATETPPFWWQKPDWRAHALTPAAFAWAGLARRRLARVARDTVDVPVLRIADLAVSVPGKTQAAMAFARAAARFGLKPGIVSAGPPGFGRAAHLVHPSHDAAGHVGDAAIEMASVSPVAVCSVPAAAARALAAQGCDFLIAPDGSLSCSLVAHCTLLVADAKRGLGNERVMPAGPLRAALTDRVRHADALLRIGDAPGANGAVRAAARAARPVYEAVMSQPDTQHIAGKRLLAFSTIKHPGGFFATLEKAGADVAGWRAYGEGHYLTVDEMAELVADAMAAGAELVTTRRDKIRIGDRLPEEFRLRMNVLDVTVDFEVEATARTIIDETVAAWRKTGAA